MTYQARIFHIYVDVKLQKYYMNRSILVDRNNIHYIDKKWLYFFRYLFSIRNFLDNTKISFQPPFTNENSILKDAKSFKSMIHRKLESEDKKLTDNITDLVSVELLPFDPTISDYLITFTNSQYHDLIIDSFEKVRLKDPQRNSVFNQESIYVDLINSKKSRPLKIPKYVKNEKQLINRLNYLEKKSRNNDSREALFYKRLFDWYRYTLYLVGKNEYRYLGEKYVFENL